MPERIIVFDVNETMLDLAALDEPFRDVFGSADAKTQWFGQLLNLAMTATIVGRYQDFSAQGRAALSMLAARRGVTLSEQEIAHIVGRMKALPPHADAQPALKRLQQAGFRLAALTNSAPAVAVAQLKHAGLAPYFEAILSVEMAHRFKPAPEPYQMAARHLGVTTAGIRMVAVHDWDITGAMAAGCRGAFVARGGLQFNPLAPQPEISEPTLAGVAEAIIRLDG